MAGKEAAAPPIDRPLSRSYLREFGGWSTAYPPGISESTTLRRMENILIKRDGGASVRPGLRSIFEKDQFFVATPLVGSFEPFFTNDGKKAVLFAVRGTAKVDFKCGIYNTTLGRYQLRTLEQAGFTVGAGLSFSAATTYVRYLQLDNKIIAMSDKGEPIRLFYAGAQKIAKVVTGVQYPRWQGSDRLAVVHPSADWINGAQDGAPSTQTATADTLISSTASANTYSYGYFYTFYNELGETAPSQIRLVTAQRGYSLWKMVAPAADGKPSNIVVSDAKKSADQLVATVPQTVFSAAQAEGALGWRLYAFTWSNQGAVPVDAVLVGQKELTADSTWPEDGWLQHTPMVSMANETMILPSEKTRENYSIPPKASQGLIVGDRVVLCYDKENPARIYWTSNLQGEYLNFSASKGGGYKTLTSGNMFIPAAVKLWQNPQSVDTITILCVGVDGYSTSYYMSPASVQGNSLATAVMGFEETTATPGTSSPFGVEVLNNVLYHPLDMELMKSTASNYNITHKSMTDLIQNKWQYLENKDKIVSSQLDNRLYYLVDNPDGIPLPAGCNGNEVWVCDTAMEGVWNRWLVPGIALRKIELDGFVYMAVVQPNGIYVFDELRMSDEKANQSGKTTNTPIPWFLETNTQGANRTHDAFARLQQIEIMLGNFTGTMQYGIRGKDIHGRDINLRKQVRFLDPVDLSARPMPSDLNDYFQTRVDLKEWFFWASSAKNEIGELLPSAGQISLVGYRYTPVSVNVGYEYGSVETFEYVRSQINEANRTTDNGIPQPFLDTSRN